MPPRVERRTARTDAAGASRPVRVPGTVLSECSIRNVTIAERETDKIVYELFGLTDEEVALLEANV